MAARVLTKDLDARLLELERRLGDIAERLALVDSRLAIAAQQADTAVEHTRACQARPSNGDGDSGGRIEQLATAVSRLDERVEKIASTLVAQASRWT